MNFVFLLLFAVLLSSCTLRTSASDDIDASNNGNQPKRNKLKFTDLNDDVLYLILEKTSLTLNLLKAIPSGTISLVAVAVYRKIYRNYKVEFYIDKMNYQLKEFHVDDDRNYIKICTCEAVQQFMKHFGDGIRTLQFNTQLFDKEKAVIISQYINKYGRKSINNLDLGLIRKNSFMKFIVPFEEVEELSINIDKPYEQEIRTGNLRLNQQFPKLRRF